MKKIYLLTACLIMLLACADDENMPSVNEGEYEGYTLVWSDEFNSTIDNSNWNFELGDGTDYGLPPGWGNNERQLYTSSQNNALIKADNEGNSVLAIVARDEPGDNNYSSSKLTTENLHSFRFGRVEARVKVPEGRGLWPAFWLLGDNRPEVDWPGCGEIDIFEVIGHEPSVVHCSAHYTNADKELESNTQNQDFGINLSEDYHLYRLDWTPEMLTLSVDKQVVNQVQIEDDMKEFLRSFYIVFNIAVGGNWPGDPDETTIFPKEMLIDWVRVYSKDDLNAPPIPELDINEETIGVLSNDIAQYAFNSSLNQFNGIGLKSFGDGGAPEITTSDNAIDGDSCLLFNYPGEGWGGGFFELDPTIDASELANSTLYFSINKPNDFHDIEVKLESFGTAVSLFLVDYSEIDVGNGYVEYSIPMADFVGLDLTDLRIPFALWNPVNSSGDYVPGVLLLDNVYIE